MLRVQDEKNGNRWGNERQQKYGQELFKIDDDPNRQQRRRYETNQLCQRRTPIDLLFSLAQRE